MGKKIQHTSFPPQKKYGGVEAARAYRQIDIHASTRLSATVVLIDGEMNMMDCGICDCVVRTKKNRAQSEASGGRADLHIHRTTFFFHAAAICIS